MKISCSLSWSPENSMLLFYKEQWKELSFKKRGTWYSPEKSRFGCYLQIFKKCSQGRGIRWSLKCFTGQNLSSVWERIEVMLSSRQEQTFCPMSILKLDELPWDVMCSPSLAMLCVVGDAVKSVHVLNGLGWPLG